MHIYQTMNSNEIEWKQPPIPPWKIGRNRRLFCLVDDAILCCRLAGFRSIGDGKEKKKGRRREQEQPSYSGKQQQQQP